MPEIPSANLNAPTLMIAEKGSEFKFLINRKYFFFEKNFFNHPIKNINKYY